MVRRGSRFRGYDEEDQKISDGKIDLIGLKGLRLSEDGTYATRDTPMTLEEEKAVRDYYEKAGLDCLYFRRDSFNKENLGCTAIRISKEGSISIAGVRRVLAKARVGDGFWVVVRDDGKSPYLLFSESFVALVGFFWTFNEEYKGILKDISKFDSSFTWPESWRTALDSGW